MTCSAIARLPRFAVAAPTGRVAARWPVSRAAEP